jgi:hypothetical protein
MHRDLDVSPLRRMAWYHFALSSDCAIVLLTGYDESCGVVCTGLIIEHRFELQLRVDSIVHLKLQEIGSTTDSACMK